MPVAQKHGYRYGVYLRTFLEEAIAEYFRQRFGDVIEDICSYHPEGMPRPCRYHLVKMEGCGFCLSPIECPQCVEIAENFRREYELIAAMLQVVRKRALFDAIGLGKGSNIMLGELPGVDKAFSPDTQLYKKCAQKAGLYGSLTVADVLRLWGKSDANRIGAASLREDYRAALAIVVAAFIATQDAAKTLDYALEKTKKELEVLPVKYQPGVKTLRAWLDRLNNIDGTGFPPVRGFAVLKSGRPKGKKNSKNSPHRPA